MDLKDIIRLADRLDAAGSYREAENLDAELVRLAAPNIGNAFKNIYKGVGKTVGTVGDKTDDLARMLGRNRAALPDTTAVETLFTSKATRETINQVLSELKTLEKKEMSEMAQKLSAISGSTVPDTIEGISDALRKIRADRKVSAGVKDGLMDEYRLLTERSMERGEGMKRLRNFAIGGGLLGGGAIGYNILTPDEAAASPASATGAAATPGSGTWLNAPPYNPSGNSMGPGATGASGGAPVNPLYNDLLTRIEMDQGSADTDVANNPTGGSANSIRGFEPTAAGIGKYFAGMYASALDRGVAPQKAMDHVTKEMGKFGVDADVYREFMRQRR